MKKIVNFLLMSVVLLFIVLVNVKGYSLVDLDVNGTDVYHYRTTRQVQIPDVYEKQKYDMRGVWITPLTSDVRVNGIDTFQSAMNVAIENMKQFNLNAMMFHVRINNDALYPSEFNPKSSYVSNIDFDVFDPIEWLVERCHEEGIEFHAWMNPYRVKTTYVYGPENPASSTTNLLYGNTTILNPSLPNVRDFLVDTCMEVIENYDIDAIHFDDYFYTDGITISRTSSEKREDINAFILDLSNTMKTYNEANDKYVQLGIAPTGVYRNVSSYDAAMNGTYNTNGDYSSVGSNTIGQEHYESYLFADTKKWIDNEWIDYIIPQSYWGFTHATAGFADVIDWWAKVVDRKNVNLYSGMGIYRTTESWTDEFEAVRQIKYVTKHPLVQGHCIFSYKNLASGLSGGTTSPAKNARNILPLWNYQALTPEVRTMDSVNLGELSSLVVSGNTLQWNLLNGAIKYAVYRSESSTINKTVGELIAVVGNKTKTFIDETAETGKTYTYALTAISRTNTEGALTYATEGVLNSISDLRVETTQFGHILKWSVDYPTNLIKSMQVYVNDSLARTVTDVVSELEITDYVIAGDNSVNLKVTDINDDLIFDGSITHNVDVTVVPLISNVKVEFVEGDYKLLWGNNLPYEMDTLEINVNSKYTFTSSEIVSEYLLNYYLKLGRNTVVLKAYKDSALVYEKTVTYDIEELAHVAISDIEV
ncbi:MAG: family 10 glycosylhydrolase, partial [Bacilli bacterium]|nr:family 10 glycosylhydrolase [Bacilli bacterium]